MAPTALERHIHNLKNLFKGSIVHKAYRALTFRWLATTEQLLQPIRYLLTRNGRFSSIYYLLFSWQFDREHKSVLSGKIEYRHRLKVPKKTTSALLRRNIHRLEKGITMRPRRRVFALDFIDETVFAYQICVSLNSGDSNNELIWAHDVLAEYFTICANQTEVAKALTKFRNITIPKRDGIIDNLNIGTSNHVPFEQGMMPPIPVSSADMLALARHRRSIRWFDGRIPPREIIDNALNVARMSPSACNRLPVRYVIVDDQELVKKVIELANGTSGYGEQVPTVAVIIGDLSSYFHERDRHLIYIDGALSAMSFAFSLECSGLGSCMINWSDIGWRERAMSKLLGLKDFERPIMLVAFGYPDELGLVPYSSKKDLSIFRSYNIEDN